MLKMLLVTQESAGNREPATKNPEEKKKDLLAFGFGSTPASITIAVPSNRLEFGLCSGSRQRTPAVSNYAVKVFAVLQYRKK